MLFNGIVEWIFSSPLIYKSGRFSPLLSGAPVCTGSSDVTVHHGVYFTLVIYIVVFLRFVGDPKVPAPYNLVIFINSSQQNIAFCPCRDEVENLLLLIELSE